MAAHETDKQRDARFQAESDVKSLVEADRIKKDKTRMSAAMKSAREQKAALENVKGGTHHE